MRKMKTSRADRRGLFSVRAAISNATAPKESWFSIKAYGGGRGEIIIYDEIGAWGITARQFAQELRALGDVRQLDVRIHSPGGDVFEGIAIYNILKAHPAHVDVWIDGLAASMASVIAMAGNVVHMPANAMMMIHKPWGAQGGEADDMRKYADLLDKVEGTLVQAYAEKSGKPADEIHALLKAVTWMDGSEAVAAGFADQITEPLQAAASLSSKRILEFANMPEALQALIAPRGSVTPQAVVPVAPTATPAAPAATVPNAAGTPEQIRAQALADEQARRSTIRASFGGFAPGHADLLASCLDDINCSADQARTKLLAALGAGVTPTAPAVPTAVIHAGNGNLVGDSVRASLMSRVGHVESQKDNAFNHMSLRELARASLVERGVGVSSLDPMRMVGLAFTHGTSDFGQILLDVAHKSVILGWEESSETYHLWTKKGILTDFKPHARVGLGEFPSLRQVRPGAEYKSVTVGDRGEQISLATYGELFSITRQAIINDDLSMLADVPYKLGQAARATIGDLVYAVLVDATKLRDGKPLFHADHKNLGAGPGSALSIEALSAGKTAMSLQKTQTEGGAPRNLNIRPAYVITPVALEDKAKQLIASESVPGVDINAGIANPLRNFATVISDARLDDANSKSWYLAAKQGSDTIEVGYLNGVDAPYVEEQQGFTVDGVITKVRIDAGVAPLDYRGLYKGTGA